MPLTTTIDLPGVYRIEEASNKAIRKLNQAWHKFRLSVVVPDSGIIYQPGDMINVVSANRGVDVPIWVETVTMIGYGRYRITGLSYATGHFSDDYVTQEQIDNLEGGFAPELNANGDPTFFGQDASLLDWAEACDSYENYLVNYSTTDTVWLMNTNKTLSTSEQFTRSKGSIPLAANRSMTQTNSGLLNAPCSTEYALQNNDGSLAIAQATSGFNNNQIFGMTAVIGPSDTYGGPRSTFFSKRQRSGVDINVGWPYGNSTDLRVQFIDFTNGTTNYRYDDFNTSSEKFALAFTFHGTTGEFTLWKNWVVHATGTQSWANNSGSPQLNYSQSWQGACSHVGFWNNTTIPTSEAEALKVAWDKQL